MISAHVYTWPEGGDVDYFLSKFAPMETDCRLLSGKETQQQTQQWWNGMICDFGLIYVLFQYFCKIIKIKTINCKKKYYLNYLNMYQWDQHIVTDHDNLDTETFDQNI